MRIFSPRGKLFNTVNLNLCLSLRWSYQFYYHFPSVCPDIIIAWDSGTHSNSHYFRHYSPKQQSMANDWQPSSCASQGGIFQGWKTKSQLTPMSWKSGYQGVGKAVSMQGGDTPTRSLLTPFERYAASRGGWENEEADSDGQSQDVKYNGANSTSLNVSYFFPSLPHMFRRLWTPKLN